jgi:hypothetical protein
MHILSLPMPIPADTTVPQFLHPAGHIDTAPPSQFHFTTTQPSITSPVVDFQERFPTHPLGEFIILFLIL